MNEVLVTQIVSQPWILHCITASFSSISARIEPFGFDLASRSFFSYPALQAFELRCVAKFFSPAGPTCMSVPQSGHSNVLSELNSFVIVLSPFRQFHVLSERSNITSFSLAFRTSKLSTQW